MEQRGTPKRAKGNVFVGGGLVSPLAPGAAAAPCQEGRAKGPGLGHLGSVQGAGQRKVVPLLLRPSDFLSCLWVLGQKPSQQQRGVASGAGFHRRGDRVSCALTP